MYESKEFAGSFAGVIKCAASHFLLPFFRSGLDNNLYSVEILSNIITFM